MFILVLGMAWAWHGMGGFLPGWHGHGLAWHGRRMGMAWHGRRMAWNPCHAAWHGFFFRKAAWVRHGSCAVFPWLAMAHAVFSHVHSWAPWPPMPWKSMPGAKITHAMPWHGRFLL